MSTFFIETSNNVQINLKPASVAHRIFACLLDILFVSLCMIITAIVFGIFGLSGSNSILYFIIIMLPLFFYNLLFEIFNKGRSFGKMIYKLQVVKEDGTSPSIGSFLLRWILRPIDIIFYGSVAIISIVLTEKGQRLGDLAAGTMVIRNKEEVTLAELTQFLAKEAYNPTFENVYLLNQSQINTIKETLLRYKTNGDLVILNALAIKVKSILRIESKEGDYKLLFTIVKDFENYNN